MCALVDTLDPLLCKSPSETSGPLEYRVAFLVAFSWNWSWLTCGKKGWFLESWQRLLSYFPLLLRFGLGGSLPNPLLDLHILSLPNKGWPCHTIVAKWTPTRGHLKKKRRPFLAWNPVVWQGYAGGYTSHASHEAASLWLDLSWWQGQGGEWLTLCFLELGSLSHMRVENWAATEDQCSP